METTDIRLLRVQAEAELNRLEAQSTAKELAGKSIGRYGLVYITIIVLIGVVASAKLPENTITAVMTVVGGVVMAIINLMNGIAGASQKQERPEFEVMKQLIDKLDKLDRKEPSMRVDVEGGKVTVQKGDDVVTTGV